MRGARWYAGIGTPGSDSTTEVLRVVDRAIGLSTEMATADRVELLIDMARLRYFTDDLADLRELCAEAVDLGRRLGDREHSIALCGTWAAIYEPGTASERLSIASQARAAARRSGSLDYDVTATLLETCSCLELGRIGEATAAIEDVRRRVVNVQAPKLTWFAHSWNVLKLTIDGDLEAAEAESVAGLMAWENGTHPEAVAGFGAHLIMFRMLQGRTGELVEPIREAIRLSPNNLGYRAALAVGLSDADPDGAWLVLEPLLRRLAEEGVRADALTMPILVLAAEAVAKCGADVALASVIADLIEPLTELFAVISVFGAGGLFMGSMHHAHALALAAADRTHEAVNAADAAIEANAGIGAPLFLARSQELKASLVGP